MITAEYAQSVGLTPEIFRERFRAIHLSSCWLGDIPTEHGKGSPSARNRAVRSNKDLDVLEKERIGSAYIEGVRVAQIARLYHISESSVYRVLDELDVKRVRANRKAAWQI